jgi:hypothetical protein
VQPGEQLNADSDKLLQRGAGSDTNKVGGHCRVSVRMSPLTWWRDVEEQGRLPPEHRPVDLSHWSTMESMGVGHQ